MNFDGRTWAMSGAALSTAVCCVASAVGVSTAGKAANGVLTEKPKLFPKAMVLTALTGSNGIYGFLISILVLQRVGILGGEANPADLTVGVGFAYFIATIPITIAGLTSVFQGRVAATAILLTAKNESQMTKGLIITALIETYAILSLLVSVLMIFAI